MTDKSVSGHYDHVGALRSYVINMSIVGRLSGDGRALQVSPYGYRPFIRLLDFRDGGFQLTAPWADVADN